MRFNPYSAELRYTLDLMIYALQATEPRSVRIASSSVEIVKALVRRLGRTRMSILVETPQLQAMVCDSLDVTVGVFERGSRPADVALFAFSLDEHFRPAGEQMIVVACENSFSYKSLIYRGQVKGTVFGHMQALRPLYDVQPIGGLYSPRFVVFWLLAAIAGRLDSAWYFRLEDHAMQRLIDFTPLWRFSYLVVFAGHAAG